MPKRGEMISSSTCLWRHSDFDMSVLMFSLNIDILFVLNIKMSERHRDKLR
jgi:hypothetical protein